MSGRRYPVYITQPASLTGLTFLMRERRRRKELDRLLVSEATSFAFAAVMLTIVTSGLLEALLDVKPLSAWIFFAVAGVSWSIGHSYFGRKYS